MASDNLAIPDIATGATQKEVGFNTSVNALDNSANRSFAFTFTANARTITGAEYTRNVRFVGGNQTAAAVLTVPLTSRVFLVTNTNATYAVTVGGVTGTTVNIDPLETVQIICDGTNCFVATVSLAGAVTDVVGQAGSVTLAELVTGGVAPLASPTFTGTVTATGATAVLVPAPSANTHAATKLYVDDTIADLGWKPWADLVDTAGIGAYTYNNGTSGVGATVTKFLTGTVTIDGVLTTLGMRIVLAGLSTPAHNGVYDVTTAGAVGVNAVFTRCVFMDEPADFVNSLIYVGLPGGSVYSQLLYKFVPAAYPPVIGTTALTGSVFARNFDPSAGTGLTYNGSGEFRLADIADKKVLANISGGAAAPTAQSIPAVLNAETGWGTQGQLLYRDASTWTVLAAGTAGYVLQTGGAGANPAWKAESYLVAMASGTAVFTSGEVIFIHRIGAAIQFPANFGATGIGTTSYGGTLTVSTGTAVVSIEKCPSASDPTSGGSWSQIGTITYSAATSAAALATASGVAQSFAQGDYIRFTAPGSPDATLAFIFATLAAIRT